MDGRRATRIAGLLSLVLAVAAASYAVHRARAADPPRDASVPVPPILPSPPAAPYMLFTTMAPGTFTHVALAPLDGEHGRFVADLACQRVYYASGKGVCLVTEYTGLAAQHLARVFDSTFRVVATTTLSGVPSRARVSPDGTRAAVTVFESGHSYADDGFSTRTTILDTANGAIIGDLEQYTVLRDGTPFKEVDFNFWGVTFARDSRHFYATLATGQRPFLVEGDIQTRTMRVLRADIECPSLSPDNRRIAFKHRLDDEAWRIEVLDLESGSITPLALETRSVDDQVDWLDDEHVVYHITGATGADVWKLRVDGGTPPEMLMPYAYSPSIVR